MCGREHDRYDDLYRLTSESAPDLSLAHAYDATGNRTAETVAGATTVYAYPPDSHRLTNIGGTARTFDEAGNLRVLNQFNRSSPEYAYDDRNRLSAYRVGGRDVATYAHNARGERVRKQLPKAGTETLFVYAEGGQLLGEYDADGNLLQEYAWLDALPVAVLKKAGLHPIEPDHLGTPRRAIAPELDRAVWAWDLQGPAFGTHPANDDPDADGQAFPLNLRFPGQYLDTESGLHYNYFRDYDPATGRYVESDPIGLTGGASTYGYVSGMPINSGDPFGLLRVVSGEWISPPRFNITNVGLDYARLVSPHWSWWGYVKFLRVFGHAYGFVNIDVRCTATGEAECESSADSWEIHSKINVGYEGNFDIGPNVYAAAIGSRFGWRGALAANMLIGSAAALQAELELLRRVQEKAGPIVGQLMANGPTAMCMLHANAQ